MAVKYISQKCDSCGSTKFEYIEKLNMWECVYCGTRIERHEEVDTMFTIKNVVRQVLIDVSYRRFSEAKNNLVECEKVDSRYVGTTIARLCYLLNAAMYNAQSREEQRNMFAQIKKYYGVLCSGDNVISEEEHILYEFLESAEAIGTLILVYDTLGDSGRLEAIYPLFKPEEVYSLQLNANLLRFMLNHQQYELADGIVANYDNIEKKPALLMLLEQYPDNPQKVANCSLLLEQNILTHDDRSIIEDYLNGSSDSIDTKYGIACASLTTAAAPTAKCVMSSIISKIEDKESVKKILDIIMSKKLLDAEIFTIIEYALEKCSQDVALYIIQRLRDTKQFVVFSQQHFILLLVNQAINYEFKKKIIDIAVSFNVNEKTKEQFISYYLLNIADSAENRKEFLSYLFTLISSLSTVSAEKYILTCTLDGDDKPEIVRMIFAMDVNKAFFRETLDKYIGSCADTLLVSEKIIDLLIQEGLKVSEGSLLKLLLNSSLLEEKRIDILRKVKNSGFRYLGLLDKYLSAVYPQYFSMRIFQELLDVTDTISADSFVKYLLSIRDAGAAKPINALKLADRCKIPVVSQYYRTTHLNNTVECTVMQAYILLSPDDPAVTCSVAESLGARSMKLNTDITASGSRMKFKKYISYVRSQISPAAEAAAQQFGLL